MGKKERKKTSDQVAKMKWHSQKFIFVFLRWGSGRVGWWGCIPPPNPRHPWVQGALPDPWQQSSSNNASQYPVQLCDYLQLTVCKSSSWSMMGATLSSSWAILKVFGRTLLVTKLGWHKDDGEVIGAALPSQPSTLSADGWREKEAILVLLNLCWCSSSVEKTNRSGSRENRSTKLLFILEKFVMRNFKNICSSAQWSMV